MMAKCAPPKSGKSGKSKSMPPWLNKAKPMKKGGKVKGKC